MVGFLVHIVNSNANSWSGDGMVALHAPPCTLMKSDFPLHALPCTLKSKQTLSTRHKAIWELELEGWMCR